MAKRFSFSISEPIFYYFHGRFLHKQGKNNDAKNQFTKNLEFDRDFADAYYQQGLILESLGKVDHAISNNKKHYSGKMTLPKKTSHEIRIDLELLCLNWRMRVGKKTMK